MRIGTVRRTAVIAFAAISTSASAQSPRFEVTYPASAHAGPLAGRLVVIIAKRGEPEPRLTVSPQGPALFAVDVSALRPDQPAIQSGDRPEEAHHEVVGRPVVQVVR